MSASDAAPLPRLGEVFFDVRGNSRTMRLSWYADTGVAVFSIWQGGTCTGTFRLPLDDLPRMIDSLRRGNQGVDPVPATGPTDVTALSPGAETAYLDEYRGRRERAAGPEAYEYGDEERYPGHGYRDQGYDAGGQATGYEGRGYAEQGYDQAGYEQPGYGEAARYDDSRYDERRPDGRGGYDEQRYDEQRYGEPARSGYQDRGYEERGYADRGYDQPGYEERYGERGYGERGSAGYPAEGEYAQRAPLSAPPAISGGSADGPFPLAYREEPSYPERSYSGQGSYPGDYPADQRGGEGYGQGDPYGYREDFPDNREQRYPRRR